MSEIIFKATKRVSSSCDGYRQIEKRGDLTHDSAGLCDDVIYIPVRLLDERYALIIDCDKKTGEFRLKFTLKDNKEV